MPRYNLRQRGYLVEGWMNIKRFLPRVSSPLYHGTKVGKIYNIVTKRKGIVPSKRYNFDGNKGVSLSRMMDVSRWFGDYFIVVDKSKLDKRKLMPVRYGKGVIAMPDEAEERYEGVIPFEWIAGVVKHSGKIDNDEYEELFKGLRIPIIHKVDKRYVEYAS